MEIGDDQVGRLARETGAGGAQRGDGLDGEGTGPVRLDANDSAEPGLGTVSAVRRGPGGTVYVLQLDGELVRLSVARP